ncbi:hypothetical protein G6F65_016891 [Rhizopus arrhizus]|nr:hypothetical protein G6F65_016891 [Rhizopus arrhizus]
MPARPLFGRAGQDAGIGRCAGKIFVAAVGRETQLDFGMAPVEIRQVGHQPGAGQRGYCGQRQAKAPLVGPQLKLAAGVGQGQSVRVPVHQGLAEMRFQAGDGAADGALGHAQRLCGLREAAQARCRDEGMQLRHGRRVQAH